LAEVELELGESIVWENPEYAQALGKERSNLEEIVRTIDILYSGIAEVQELFSLAIDESDEELYEAADKDLVSLLERL